MTEVEIFWPAAYPLDAVHTTDALLRESGIQATYRRAPMRRGPETYALVLLAGHTLQPFLRAVFERVGADAYSGLRTFVSGLIGRKPAADAPGAVVFECVSTRAQFVFTHGLPDAAYRQALALDPGTTPGRWAWQDDRQTWVRFEERAAAGGPAG
ncbi:hypothetical protein [Streptomyces sp. NPDC052496]|uniref:hypothetical protein n=1 Tax=Streptomyces sp. NPDC052496 TaxID=3154951 RepID=UPI0034439A25